MTVTSTLNKVTAEGNGATVQFSYSFLIPSSDVVDVIYTDALGNDTYLATNLYSISGLGDPAGGLVTYPLVGSPIAGGTFLTIVRNLPLKQLISIKNQGGFYPDAVDNALDYEMMVIQQVNEIFNRALVTPITDIDVPLPLPTAVQRANQLLGFDGDGNPIAAQPSSALVSSAMQPVVSAATLALARTALGLGNLATLALGRGLRSSAGVAMVNYDTTKVATNQAPGASNHLTEYFATGALTFTLPPASTFWDGYGFWIYANTLDCTLVIDAGDFIKGLNSGVSLTIPAGARVFVKTDGVATWYVSQARFSVPLEKPLPFNVIPGGRLCLSSGVPVPAANVSGATTVFYTPYIGAAAMMWNAREWYPVTFAELSQALNDATKSPAATVAGSNYDFFLWDDASTIRCTRGPAWTSDTARGTGAGTTELGTQDGCLVNANAITRGPAAGRGVYVGTIRTNASNQVDMEFLGAAAAGGNGWHMYVWNMYHRILFSSTSLESTNSWGYTTAVWRATNNSASNRISLVRGLNEESAQALASCLSSNASTAARAVGIGLDDSTAPALGCSLETPNVGQFASRATLSRTQVGLGFHFFQALEYSEAVGATTWYGDNGTPSTIQQSLQLTTRM